MKIGKLPEPVLIRSVLKEVQHRRPEVLVGPAVGQDCAVLEPAKGDVLVFSSDPITGTIKDMGSHSVHITANDLAASGAEPLGIMVTILLTPETEEAQLKEMMRGLESACEELNIEVMGGHTEITDVVKQPLISITGVGRIKKEEVLTTSAAKPGQDVVITKWIGLEGTSIAAKEKEKKLLERFAPSFVETAKRFDRYLSVVPEAKIAKAWGVSAMHDITEGGVFGALWEMAAAGNVGLTVDLKKVPLKQETVEICEYFDLNPYQLISSGSMLIACDRGHDLAERLKKEGIHSAVIGKFTDNNDKIIVYDEGETRYLEPPKTDELYKL